MIIISTLPPAECGIAFHVDNKIYAISKTYLEYTDFIAWFGRIAENFSIQKYHFVWAKFMHKFDYIAIKLQLGDFVLSYAIVLWI